MLIALPKGRLLPEIKDLFYKIGIEFDENSRKLIIYTSKENIKIAILRTWDIPKFVNYGVADVGIVGKDILFETDLENNYYEVLDLNILHNNYYLNLSQIEYPSQQFQHLQRHN
jgi:ATP phosphoribosyltransferase